MIELSADIGEGGADALLMPYVDRVSIACGGHAGDVASMRAALLLAKESGIKAGVHPSYPDPANFGRVNMQSSPEETSRWVKEQTRALMEVADGLNIELFHVKPHGALYNRAATNRETADAVIAAIKNTGLALVALANSPLVGWAREAGLVVLEEAFADRRYLKNGQLAPRSRHEALLESPAEVVEQALAIARGEPIITLDDGNLLLHADTLCLHGDAPGTAGRAEAVALALAFFRRPA